MENNERDHDNPETPKDLTPISIKANQSKKESKSKSHSQKADAQKDKSWKRSWRSSSPVRKVEIIFLGIGTAAAIGYIGVTVWQTLQTKWISQIQYAPLVIHSRPPEFLQPFTCSAETGFHSGNMQSFVKNKGNARAVNVNPYMSIIKIIPEHKTGNPFIDDLPAVNCDGKFKMPGAEFNLAPGDEVSPQIRQTAMTLPPLAKDSIVQLYDMECVFYLDDYAANHATCDTYRLELPSTNSLDKLRGSPSFTCDGTERIGKFTGAITGHCQN